MKIQKVQEVFQMFEYSNDLSPEEYSLLRSAVSWLPLADEQVRSALENSDFIIACHNHGMIAGCARIFWDKGYIAYLADVMVRPEYQGQGIGSRLVQECISYIDSQLKKGWRIKIVIVSAKGKESFYEKFGFQIRPNDFFGPGMDQWRE